MTRVRAALIGMGRMGQAIDALAAERGVDVVARCRAQDMADPALGAHLAGAEVAIEVTRPDAVVGNVDRLTALGLPVVIGTTGWADHLPAVERLVRERGARVLWSPNFSLGVQVLLACAERLAALLRDSGAQPGFDVHVVETHHTAKRDAPSGTALAIAQRLAAGGVPDVPITSVRTGFVPGTHDVVCDGPFEQIRLTHEARDRRVFADGALVAARWLVGVRTPGIYGMQDLLRTSTGTDA